MRHAFYIRFFTGALCFIAAGLMSCIDESLREDRSPQDPTEGTDDGSEMEIIREVTDPEAALATANCMLIVPGGRVSIPIAKAFAVWTEYRPLLGKVSLKGDLAPVLLWAYPEDLIDMDELDITDYEDINKAAITVRASKDRMGSALIALAVDGTIRWSWHIWVTDYIPGMDLQPGSLAIGSNDVTGGKVYRYKNKAGDNIFMDRDLGAFPREYAEYGYNGMSYQWGRKDPFPGFAPLNFTPIKDGTVPEPQTPATYEETNMAYAIEHPDEMIAHGRRNNWYSYIEGNYDDDLWGGVSRKKTIWDPCPEGWRIPWYGEPLMVEGPYGYLIVDRSQSPIWVLEDENQFIDFTSPILGTWSNDAYLYHDTGEPNATAERPPFYWSGSSYPPDVHHTNGCIMRWDVSAEYHFKGDAMHVRCVRDISSYK